MPFLLKLGKDYNVTVGYRIYSIYRPGRLKIFEPGNGFHGTPWYRATW